MRRQTAIPPSNDYADPKNAELTAQALALGWQSPAARSRFDLLPWIIAGRDGHPKLFPLTPSLVREVPLRHPDLGWFEKLGLRWYAVPVISDMRLHAAGTDYCSLPMPRVFTRAAPTSSCSTASKIKCTR
jgi:nitric-oxide synthase